MTNSTEITRYGYRPIAYYGGSVLKCIGIVDRTNWEFLSNVVRNNWHSDVRRTEDNTFQSGEMVVLDGYHGDRINAEDHSEFTDR